MRVNACEWTDIQLTCPMPFPPSPPPHADGRLTHLSVDHAERCSQAAEATGAATTAAAMLGEVWETKFRWLVPFNYSNYERSIIAFMNSIRF